MAALAQRHGATVIVDEVHGPLVHGPTPFVPWLSVADHGFAITSAAKGFNLAGLKAGLILAGSTEKERLAALPKGVRYGASHLGILAHMAAYRADPGWIDGVNAAIAANVVRLRERLADALPDIGFLAPQATFLAWLDCRDLGLTGDPADVFLKHGHVALSSGAPFGPGGRGWARINVACSAAVLDEAVDRMALAVEADRSHS